MSSIQNATGKAFEKEFLEILSSKGYWAYRFPIMGGQPCDIIAVKGDIAKFFECKTSDSDTFNISRLESNQWTSIDYLASCGNYSYSVVIKFKSGIKRFSAYNIIGRKILKYEEGDCIDYL